MCGDFNEILNANEKKGGRLRENWSLIDFRNMVNICKVSDLPFQGNNMTWLGKRRTHIVESWIDRAMANDQWKAHFPASEVEYLELIESDHRPAIIKIRRTTEKGTRPFLFDTRLCKIPEVELVVKNGWNDTSTNFSTVLERIRTCRHEISRWKRENNTNSAKRIKELISFIDKATTDPGTSTETLRRLRRELLFAYREEERYWKVKSRNQWLNEGDLNTRYFHAATKNRIARNRLTSIQGPDGVDIFGNKNIATEAQRYFSDLFTSSTPRNLTAALQHIKPVVSTEVNESLLQEITTYEIRQALFAIGATRAPGPDGFNAAFYQHYWNIVGPAISTEVKRFFRTGSFDKDWNHTNLCLIPKIKQPKTMKDFRPISLCNVIYKIISKILVKRLKSVLSSVVSENQAAFIPGRHITDNVFIAHEVFHSLRVKKRCAKDYMAVKTDISKAYDRIEWRFLEEVLKKKGFANQWIQWIMTCVRTVSFSVLINGIPYGRFEATRGLRQGDPLSPYLFILCSDVLSSMLTNAQMTGEIKGIRVSNGGPAISHLLFADDSLFFLKADRKNSSNLLKIFEEYGEASGQMINLDKSAITFGSHVYQSTRDHVMQTLKIPNSGGGGKYLGLPEQFGRKKKEMFQFISDSVQGKISGWQTKFLTAAGKETLIKSVAYAMPVYSMNVFQLPKELCSEINSMIARFWWGTTPDKKKLSWVSWQKMTTPKKQGGLGFRDLHQFNQALLASQVWKLLQRPESLLYRMLKARYFRNGNMLTATRGTRPSYGWSSLRFGCELLRVGTQKNIGDGRSTKLGEPWLPTNPPRPPALLPTTDPDVNVCSLINPVTHQWDEDKLSEMINQNDIPIIWKIYLPQAQISDSYIWSHTKDGCFTVKSGYWTAATRNLDDATPSPPLAANPDIATSLWQLNIAPKLKHFLWRTASRAIGLADNLRRRNIIINPYCARCCTEFETGDHVFFSCPHAVSIWRATGLDTTIICDQNHSFEDKLRYLFTVYKATPPEELNRYLPFWTLWRLWKSRNDLVFNRSMIDAIDTLNYATADAKEWLENVILKEKPHVELARQRGRRDNWLKPERGWVKCNYDASHRDEDGDSGMGWIIRDSHGSLLHCGLGKFEGRMTAEEAECSALIWGIQASWALGYRSIVFEGDNKNITRTITDNLPNLRLRTYLQTIQLWRSNFTNVKFNFTHREQNACADLLAKKAATGLSLWNLYHSCPPFLMSLVNCECV
ncbi:Reverse transcriptase zinc-binding domain [Arabidopsis thaliana x Arabidopsis arenosa]|uniref:Reverse transcriptase zinc-binding domain n=1 Tax=Arabidopsis thaliana x Arabidopsis arenosa TaxID=1240361 RepID=A0A8T1ZIP0_9BRAS|nr:Reverse transcriptase zinc-binding domain [Arabidopsis thaliana x Arabidopsis arenosa]